MTHIKGVLLDVDGTLVDSNDAHAHAWVEALQRGGYKVTYERIRPLIGMGSDNLVPEVTGLPDDSPQRKQLSEWWKEAFTQRYLSNIKPFHESRDLLKRMKQAGLTLVVASSAEQELLDALLKIAGAEDLVEQTTSSSDAKKSKPHPDIVQVALKSIKLPPEQVVMLGDTPYDVEACRKAGVGIIALRCGGWTDPDLKGALAIYDDPADLLHHFDSSSLSQ